MICSTSRIGMHTHPLYIRKSLRMHQKQFTMLRTCMSSLGSATTSGSPNLSVNSLYVRVIESSLLWTNGSRAMLS